MIDIITIAGGLTRDAELRFTSSGQAVTNFTLAQSDRYKDDQGEWQTKQSLYLDVDIWNENSQYKQNPTPWAELAAGLKKGDKVAVTGKLITRQWEDRQGNKRSRVEFQAREFYVVPQGDAAAPQQQGGSWGGQQAQQQPQVGNWAAPAATNQQGMQQAQANVNTVMNSEPPF